MSLRSPLGPHSGYNANAPVRFNPTGAFLLSICRQSLDHIEANASANLDGEGLAVALGFQAGTAVVCVFKR